MFTRKEDTIWRGGQLLARVAGSSTMNYTLDHLGSTRLITDGSGSVLGQQDFDPFGGGGLFGSGAENKTKAEIDKLAKNEGPFQQAAKQMKKLIEQAERLRDKIRNE